MKPERSIPDASLVSILLPTFDRAALLPRAIESVLAQTYAAWELLVVDDGSRDSTPAIVAGYSARDARIRAFRQDNRGPSAARNLGLRRARGAFIACLDSDDAYLPRHLELRVGVLIARPEIALIHGGAVVVGPPEAAFVPDVNDRTRMIAIADCIVGGTFVARRATLEAVGGWRDGYGEDYELFGRIAAQYPVLKIEEPTYLYYRDSAESRRTDPSV